MKKTILFLFAIITYSASANAQSIAGNNLDINNIKAGIYADGGLFWNNTNSVFEVPKGSGKLTIFASGLWIGGYDSGGQLHLAGQTYRQSGIDFFPGPIDTTDTYGTAYNTTYDRVWKINKCDIETYENWFMTGGPPPNTYIDSAAMETITNWPAFNMNGQPLAPFVDVNGDGVYDPIGSGDYPLIKGDQAIFFVYNDARGTHTETGGLPLGIEIQGMAYAYSCSNDSALYNTIFTNYKIINKSGNRIDSAFIGNFTDTDIGWYNDDFIGCDVKRGAYYGYNGAAIDGTGQASAYGNNPPAQAVVFLKGPYADQNGLDDSAYTTPNGTGYGDGITDNERLGMSRFMNYNNDANPVNGNPGVNSGGSIDDSYQYISGKWKNGTRWTYGGGGTAGTIQCNYMSPGISDPDGYGVGGNSINPIVMPNWDETSSNNVPGDRRGVGSYGPFTFKPHTTQEIDFAYVYGRATSGGNLASVTVMKNRIDSVRQKFNTIITGCGCSTTTGINTVVINNKFVIYPNPVSDNITVDYKPESKNVSIQIYDATGQLVKQEKTNFQSIQTISVNDLSNGLYLLNLQDGENIISKKFLKE